ncbi:hypothetical protein [Croceibacterium ferulae]|uniref:hypothetical protein n=1 Tax=Croceibacterium ferulae TaxID=1854641 RepID=UPI000EB5837E|nr:hypothetical protein [Croceibacterium ferulae]
MRRPFRLIATTAASLALLTTPVLARDHHRGGWNDRGWHDRGWDRRHRDNGIGAGEVIAGVAVLGAIAAIAGVFDGGNDRRNEPVPVRYPEQDQRGYAAGTGSGLDSAVDICVAEIEATGPRISGVDSANRTADGWFVSGALDSGAPFTCRIGNDGRVADVQVGDNGGPVDGGYYNPAADDRQYDDSTYYRARSGLGDGQSYSAR